MIDQLIAALVASKNEAADDLLLEALKLGNEPEKAVALDALMRRKTTRGLSGAIALYASLPDALKLILVGEIRTLHHALRECGRSPDMAVRTAALRLIALGRQGKLTYVLSENLHETDEPVSKTAVDAIVALARWVSTEARHLQAGSISRAATAGASPAAPVNSAGHPAGAASTSQAAAAHSAPYPPDILSADHAEQGRVYKELLDQRPEIEQAVSRAMDIHRGRHGQELLRAALLLCDWPGSKTLAILHTAKHGGQSAMVRRLQQPPASEHVEAFLLGGSHGQLRSHFGSVFSHIDEAPVLDALLRKTHWLKDNQLQLCMHQVTRGVWWGDAELNRDIERRDAGDAAKVGEWIAASGVPDVLQDEKLDRIRLQIIAGGDEFSAKIRLLRIAARRPRRSSVHLFRQFLADADERIVRVAVREIVRRRPPEFENMVLQLMTSGAASVRRVVSRAVGQSGFEQFWTRFDTLDRATRKSAGRAMFKMLPDSAQRLSRKLLGGPVEQRLKALQIAHELGLGDAMKPTLLQLSSDSNARLRSKAISLLGSLTDTSPDMLLDRVLQDTDARVRANAIEVLEAKQKTDYLPLLAQRARAANNRERANAIKALGRMRVKSASTSLMQMLRDERPEHRISAMWALKQIGWWQLLNEVGRLAKEDGNIRVRRYALAVLRGVADMMRRQKKAVNA